MLFSLFLLVFVSSPAGQICVSTFTIRFTDIADGLLSLSRKASDHRDIVAVRVGVKMIASILE